MMAKRPHERHRYRIASRCLSCSVAWLGVCSYRTCAATIDYTPTHKQSCIVTARGRKRPRTVDLYAEARRIFADDLLDTLSYGSESP